MAAILSGMTAPAFAQESIDGTSETVIGGGSGTKPDPWAIGGTLAVGDTGTGSLAISASGEVSNTIGYIGNGGTGNGTVTVSGTDSIWTNSSTLDVGYIGTGTLDITSGGAVRNTAGTIAYGNLATGAVTVTGADSIWDNSSTLTVGRAGTATLEISAGGKVTNSSGVIGNFTSGNGTVTVDGAGSKWVNSFSLSVGQSGTAKLDITDGGLVSNSNAYIGGSGSGTGTVTVNGTNSTWINSSQLIVGHIATGTLTISAGGTAKASSMTIANFATSTGTLNIGAAAGDAAAPAGTLETATVQFGAGSGTLTFNHTDSAYSFSADISGSGTINHLAGETFLNGDSSGFTGTLNITGGKLGGTGKLGGVLNIASGGSLAPGNSIGTLNAASVTLNAGSVYEVELSAGGFTAGTNNDLLNATGTVTINSGSSIKVKPENGTDNGTTYTAGTYTIITAGSVAGTFSSVTDDYAFLDFAVSYDATHAYLTSSIVSKSFCLSGMSTNQCAAGDGAYSLSSGSLFNAVLNLSSTQAPIAVDQLSGEIHASVQTALIED
ncbi:autotransporter domain-containing protein, partial [Hoeflea sp. AS60]